MEHDCQALFYCAGGPLFGEGRRGRGKKVKSEKRKVKSGRGGKEKTGEAILLLFSDAKAGEDAIQDGFVEGFGFDWSKGGPG